MKLKCDFLCFTETTLLSIVFALLCVTPSVTLLEFACGVNGKLGFNEECKVLRAQCKVLMNYTMGKSASDLLRAFPL